MIKNVMKDNAPSISVIIPVFNGMSTLAVCLDSLEKQDYPIPFEVIIVDDGSTDGSGDYGDSRGVNVIRQKNNGPGMARNTGAEAAKGEYLVFTDDDCIWDHDYLSELVKRVLSGDFIGGQGTLYTNQKSLVARFIQHEYSERVNLKLKSEHIDWVATHGACYQRTAFLEAGGFNDTYSSEDCELSFRLGQKGYRMAYAPKAKLAHKHFESLWKFVIYKYKRAYWTVWLYHQHPDRIVSDKLTPSSRKTMMVYLLLSGLFLVSAVLWNFGFYLSLLFLVIFLGHTVSLTLRVLKTDKVVGLMTPTCLC